MYRKYRPRRRGRGGKRTDQDADDYSQSEVEHSEVQAEHWEAQADDADIDEPPRGKGKNWQATGHSQAGDEEEEQKEEVEDSHPAVEMEDQKEDKQKEKVQDWGDYSQCAGAASSHNDPQWWLAAPAASQGRNEASHGRRSASSAFLTQFPSACPRFSALPQKNEMLKIIHSFWCSRRNKHAIWVTALGRCERQPTCWECVSLHYTQLLPTGCLMAQVLSCGYVESTGCPLPVLAMRCYETGVVSSTGYTTWFHSLQWECVVEVVWFPSLYSI